MWRTKTNNQCNLRRAGSYVRNQMIGVTLTSRGYNALSNSYRCIQSMLLYANRRHVAIPRVYSMFKPNIKSRHIITSAPPLSRDHCEVYCCISKFFEISPASSTDQHDKPKGVTYYTHRLGNQKLVRKVTPLDCVAAMVCREQKVVLPFPKVSEVSLFARESGAPR